MVARGARKHVVTGRVSIDRAAASQVQESDPTWAYSALDTRCSGENRMNRKGFTLIELLIVVVIIGILAAIAIPKFANTKEKAYIASMKSDLRNLVTAEEAYFADSIKYTTSISCANPAPA